MRGGPVSCRGDDPKTHVASDYSGATVTFNPTSPGSPQPRVITHAGALLGVACPSAAERVVTAQLGYGFVGFTPPVNRARPTVSGTPRQVNRLTERHGTWAGFPTGFSYQWFDCGKAGVNCSVIAGATGQGYTLKGSDVGHTIRVSASAVNVAGRSGAVSSAQTGS